MPRDNDKNNDSRGRRDRPVRRQGPLRRRPRPREEIRQARLCRQSDGEARWRAAPLRRQARWRAILWQEAVFGSGQTLCRQARRSAAAPRWRCARPARFNRDDRSGGGEKRAYAPRGDRPSFNRDDRPRGDGEKRPYTPRRVEQPRVIAAMPVPPGNSPIGNLATRSPTPRERVAARSGPIRRVATGRRAIGPTARGRRATMIARAAIGPNENSAATRSSPRAAHRTAVRARISAAGPTGVQIAASPSRGRNATRLRPIMPDAIRARPAMAHAISTSRAAIVPKFDRPREDRDASARVSAAG